MSAPIETKPVASETPVVIDEPKVTGADVPAQAPEPVKAEVEKQPTATHVESGTAHTDAEPATKVDGTPAAVVADETAAPAEGEAAAPASKTTTEVAEDKKEDKKVAIKDKTEKTKVEGKSFFAKIFGSKDKSPKKPKVKTPKAEKSDPTPAAATTEEPATEAAKDETTAPAAAAAAEPVEVTGAAITTDTAEPAPAHAEAPAVPIMDTKSGAELVKETEITAAAPAPVAATETKPDEPVAAPATKDEKPNLKATRRLSARFTSFVHKMGGKRDGATTPPKDDKDASAAAGTKEIADAKAEPVAATAVSDEAPKLETPVPAEPLKIDETKPAAPPAATTVSTAA